MLSNAMRVQCRRGCENDRQRHQRTECHAGNRIDADPGKFQARLLRRHAKRLGVVAVFLLDFLPCLPEEQIGLMVVPRIATMAIAYAPVSSMLGTNKDFSAVPHGTSATNNSDIENSESVVHFRIAA